MMMRVKLVIMSSSDGSTVSRLIRTRIWSESASGLPSPDTWPSARLSALDWMLPAAGGLTTPVPGAAVCAKAGCASNSVAISAPINSSAGINHPRRRPSAPAAIT